MLCQLSYARSRRTASLLARFLVNRVPSELLVVFLQLKSLGPLRLFRDSVVPQPGLGAFQPNKFASHLILSDSHETRATFASPGPHAVSMQALHSVFKTRQRSNYSRIFVTTPEPTVLPPSRIAKRTFSTIAIGLPSVTCMVTLSPGMHISAPPNSDDSPVTSVVLK